MLYRPYTGDGVRINELGLRTAMPAPKSDGEWRIAITGGSAAWGWHILDADTIASQLQQRLRREGRTNVTVYNFGIEGALLRSELELLKEFKERYAIDQVIFYTGSNDAYAAYNAFRTPGGGELSRFELVKALQRLLAGWSAPPANANEALQQKIRSTLAAGNSLRSAMTAVLDYCASERLRCDFALQPMIFDLRNPVGSDAKIKATVQQLFPGFEALARALYGDALAATSQDRRRDLRAVFDKADRPVFLDYVHTSEFGYRLVADELFKHVPLERPARQQLDKAP